MPPDGIFRTGSLEYYVPGFFQHSSMPWQCLSMHGQPVYGGSPVVPILGSPRCLCYCHTQGSTVFLYAVYPAFWGHFSSPYPVYSSKQCYLQVSVTIHSHTMVKVSQAPLSCPVAYFLCRWRCFLMSLLLSLSLHVTPRILLRHAISNTFSHCSEEHFIVQVSEL